MSSHPGSRPGRATTRRTKAAAPESERRRTTIRVPRKDNTPVIIGAAGGGALLLIIIIAAAASGGKKQKPPPKVQQEEYVAPVEKPTLRIDTGVIMFVCSNSPGHPDEEFKIGTCSCGARARFFVDSAAQGYRCTKCNKVYDNALIKCQKCGKVPAKTKLKHIAD